nr:hypothetical protein [Tanacetum cinerariifolium]
MSDASSAVTYTSVYTDFEPWRYYGEELAEVGSPGVNVYGYDGLLPFREVLRSHCSVLMQYNQAFKPAQECSSCEALYPTDYYCSNGSLRDKIICDLNKTPDLSQRPPQNCPKCENPVDGQYCQGCALLRKKFKEDMFTYYEENGILQCLLDTSESSYDNTNIANALQEPFVVKQDPVKIPYKELAVCINTLSWDHPTICYNDDDDEDYTITITRKEPDNSLSIGDEHLDTILTTKSDEFIKSSIENLVPNPSESEDKYECDVPACNKFTTFSNLLFDIDDDFSSYPHHFNVESNLIESLLNHDSSIISSSSKIDSLLDEFAEICLIKRLLYDNSSPRPPKEFISENSDAVIETVFPSPIPVEDSDSFTEEIDLSFTSDNPMPSGIEEDDYDSERDILIFEELLSNDSLSLPKNESFYFNIPSSSRPPAKPPDGNSGILNVKVMGDISKHKVPMPRLMLTQPTLVPNQEKSPNFLSHQGHEAS